MCFVFGNGVPLLVHAGFELVPNLLPQSPKYCDYRYETLHLLRYICVLNL